MRKTRAVNAEEIVIMSYWPRRQEGEEHIGFGFSRNYLLYTILTIPLTIIMDWFIRPRLQPVLSPRMQPAVLILPLIILSILFIPASRRAGFYILDEQGKATIFLKRWSPGFLKRR